MKRTNIIVNYLIFETILRLTGYYTCMIEEIPFLDGLFSQAMHGSIDFVVVENQIVGNSVTKTINAVATQKAKQTAIKTICDYTGASAMYWTGEKRMGLGARVKIGKDTVSIQGDINLSIENLDFSELFSQKSSKNNSNSGLQGYGDLKSRIKTLRDNPLNLDTAEIYKLIYNKSEDDIPAKLDELYSLRGLLTLTLLNMEKCGKIELDYETNLSISPVWKPFLKNAKPDSRHYYCPKFVEMREGVIWTIVKNLYDRNQYIF